ncbi:hypothetical protein BBBOND_0101150 [Babesia bigemina]|uniref:Uncharacterized protein n=1 Tax=Babesia bigemina TaxID=5866 RepID=A0A061CYU6_BABBI|nr:hypothetical protein BBBOND_0101150 [Babesia bigemina]CDR93786.1 hypothetical protein BBBOND_0101150 [Babesia bigemina]|eukprot:XP_012765972.1 hypothetical protein BBBOND_0101150 [Babesia bigemina]
MLEFVGRFILAAPPCYPAAHESQWLLSVSPKLPKYLDTKCSSSHAPRGRTKWLLSASGSPDLKVASANQRNTRSHGCRRPKYKLYTLTVSHNRPLMSVSTKRDTAPSNSHTKESKADA